MPSPVGSGTAMRHRARNILFLSSALVFLFSLTSNALATQAELDQVNLEIWNKGAQWFAGETSISKPRVRKTAASWLDGVSGWFCAEKSFLAQSPSANTSSLPSRLNYADLNYVTPVKNQYSCGACWATATVAALESQTAMATGALMDLSEQALISCGELEHARQADTSTCFGLHPRYRASCRVLFLVLWL